MRVRQNHRVVQLALGLTLAMAWLALASAPASAKVTRGLLSRFTGYEAPSGEFGFVLAQAVDNSGGDSEGDVYVGALSFAGGTAIEKFTTAGKYAGVDITGAETPAGSLGLISFETFAIGDIAVDDSSSPNKGDLYAADIEHHVVDKFDESGKYLCQITGSASPSLSECNGPAGSATPAGTMEPRGITVNSSGDVFVADGLNRIIDEFGPSGEYLKQIQSPHIVDPGVIAPNASGDLYVQNGNAFEEGINIVEFNASGQFVSELASVDPLTLAVDSTTGHVVVQEQEEGKLELAEFDSSGEKLGHFGEEQSVTSLAVNSASNEVYAGGLFDGVSVYGPAVVLPEATTNTATEIQEKSATLNGEVEPDLTHGGGDVLSCQFEYVTQAQSQEHGFEGASTAPCSPATPYAAAAAVKAAVTLSPSTTYDFRLSAADLEGTAHGGEQTLTTPGPPSVEDGQATAVAQTATVRAQIVPYGHETSCELQYVDEAEFSQSGYANATSLPCEPSNLGSGFAAQSTSIHLTALNVATTYHFRFIGVNSSGTTTGADSTFTTFGVQKFVFELLNAKDEPETQAGAHPYSLLTEFELNTTTRADGNWATDANLRNLETELPPGVIGNINVVPKCTRSQLTNFECSGASQVGRIDVLTDAVDEGPSFYFPGLEGENNITGLYNLVPPPGVPAEFGAQIGARVDVFIDSNVRAGGDYGITAKSVNSSTAAGVAGAAVELWGVPADPSHDEQRDCPAGNGPSGTSTGEQGPCSAGVPPQPFLTNPTLCDGPQTARIHVDSWQDPGAYASDETQLPAFTGCNKLIFPPSITTLPDTSAADSPSGVSVNLRVPQNNEAPEALATPALKDAVVTLPAGVTLNPADANGLQACSPQEIGLESPAEPTCPSSSKVGSVEIETPLLPDKLLGSVYLAEQGNNPFHSLVALYVTAQADGALIKVAGHVELDPLTGQLTTTFDDNPQVPFSDFRLHFFGGPRAPLATPNSCGTYTTTSEMTPWSAPESGPPATPFYSFQITTGPGGVPCSPLGFAPGFSAGTTSNQAGGFTPFTLSMTRNDGEQNLGAISTAMPPGVVGMLSKVPLCGEPQASDGSCPAASMIGHVTVGVGAGNYPLQVPGPGSPPDPVYLTGPYKGAPFGLSVVVPAEAGPFNLDENGRPVVVRAAIEVDPTTAQVTVVSDPLPQILQGVPLDIRLVDVTIDRPEFIVNPTSCEPMHVGGLLTGALGASSKMAVPFQVTNCAALGFKPQFQVSSSGKTSRLNGASLDVKLSYPSNALGKDANIHLVKVELPKQLPSRLATLQKACPDSTFNTNPAQCPAASQVGSAAASTPILAGSLSGPAYFVSHGGAKFPELIIVLQGDGVTVDLHGETFISKKGITSSTFATVPDVPVSTFELKLPEGSFSALTALGNLCKDKNLSMPTEFVGQNGALINTDTKIAVTGCGKAKQTKHKKRAKAKHKHGRKRR